MQTKYPPRQLRYVKKGIDETEYSQVVYERYEIIKNYMDLKKQHCDCKVIFKVLNVKRSTFFRWKRAYEKYGLVGLEDRSRAPDKRPRDKWSRTLEKLVLKIRIKNPVWGKKKIFAVIKRDYRENCSLSTIGRILKHLVLVEKVKPASFYFGRLNPKNARAFTGHAKRWKYGMKAKTPGELIQVDHAVVEAEPERFVKQFDATCPITKITVSQFYYSATSNIASDFLNYMQQQFPFEIKSIQVDGGSEFMGNFEKACKDKNIDLWVLPPRSPKFNGNVERRHATIKYEFFSTYDGSSKLEEIRPELAKWIDKYNKYRPHESLDFETPWSFYLKLEA